MALWLVVFASDAVIGYLAWMSIDAWEHKRVKACLTLSVLFDFAAGINSMGFIEMRWGTMVPSILGGLLGTVCALWKAGMLDRKA